MVFSKKISKKAKDFSYLKKTNPKDAYHVYIMTKNDEEWVPAGIYGDHIWACKMLKNGGYASRRYARNAKFIKIEKRDSVFSKSKLLDIGILDQRDMRRMSYGKYLNYR